MHTRKLPWNTQVYILYYHLRFFYLIPYTDFDQFDKIVRRLINISSEAKGSFLFQTLLTTCTMGKFPFDNKRKTFWNIIEQLNRH